MDIIISIIAGLCLSASCGFRVFIPLLTLSIALSIGWINLPHSAEWLSSTPVLISLGVAALFELTGYYIPWMDNMLDLITTPLALLAGITVMSIFVAGFNPFLKWIIMILIGGGAAINIQFLTVKTRTLSSFVVTTGLGNQVFATVEFLLSVIISITAVTIPMLSITLLIVTVFIIRRAVKSADTKRKLLIT